MRIAGMSMLASLYVACGSVPSEIDASDDPVDAASIDGGLDGPGTDTATCVVSPASTVSRWRAEQNTTDGPGPHDGVAVGGFGYTPGAHGMAFLLDGVDDVVAVADGDALWPSGSFSVEAWVRTTTTTSSSIVSKYACGNACPNGQSNAYWGLHVSSAGKAIFDLRADADPNIISVTATLGSVNDDNWHHIVGVRDITTSEGRLYVDGALAVTLALTSSALGAMSNADGDTDTVVIGGGVTAGATTYRSFFNGAIDEVAYYSGALTTAEIAAIHAAPDGFCP